MSPDGIDDRLTETVDWETEYVPGVTVTVGSVLVTAPALIVAVMVLAVPEVVDVKTAVYLPLSVSALTDPNVPLDDPLPKPKATVTEFVNRFPWPSRASNVTKVVSPELIEVRFTDTVD